MTKLCIISDTHGMESHVRVPPADIFIHCGDYSGEGDQTDTIAFLKWFERHPHVSKILISGNHDKISDCNPNLFRDLLAEYAPNVVYLQDSGVQVGDLFIYGSPVTPTFFNWFHMRDRGAAIRKHWDLIPDHADVLVTHGPPKGYGDWSPYDRIHAGDEDLLEAIKRVRPKLTLCGHFHQKQTRDELIHENGSKTMLVNATICNEAYRPVNQPVMIDL